jgi:hypothetical protein
LSLATDVVLHVVCSLCASPHGRAPGRRGGSVIDTVPVFVAAAHGLTFLSHTTRHPLSSCPGGNEEVGHSDGDRSKAGEHVLILNYPKDLRIWQDNNHSDDKEWVDYFEKLKILDEKMQKDYAGEIENFLTFVR